MRFSCSGNLNRAKGQSGREPLFYGREGFARYQATLPSGIELWQFGLPTSAVIDQSKVQLAFHYTWATGSAWDNNCGRNYRLNSIITR